MSDLAPHREEELRGRKVTKPRARAVISSVERSINDLGVGGLRDAMSHSNEAHAINREPAPHPYRRFP